MIVAGLGSHGNAFGGTYGYTVGMSAAAKIAPRVAGLAALVRGKFPNLTRAQSASILLDTANYQGLVCHPDCPLNIYGQGRGDIANAVSPIGKLQ